MSDHQHHASAEGIRLAIDPEPSDEELVAIMQALQELQEAETPGVTTVSESNWERIARREGVRPVEWPPQRLEWSVGRR